MAIEVEGIDQLDESIKRLLDRLNRNERRKILRKGAAHIRTAAREFAPRAEAAVQRYSTPKVTRKLRAPKGMGVVAATYVPGNLQKAIQTLTFRRSDDVFVGPRKGPKDTKGIFGASTARVDPYYAHMVHDGTVHFPGQPFMKQAFESKKGIALQTIQNEFKKQIESTPFV